MILKQKKYAILPEFLIPVSNLKLDWRKCSVIYVRTDNLPEGYYKIINCRKSDIDIATQFGLCTVRISVCYYTQELILARKRGEQVTLLDNTAHSGADTEWLNEIQEKINPINQIEL